MNIKDWTQIKLTVSQSDLYTATAIMGMIDLNLQIEDYSDIDLKTCYGDLIDESILNADKTVAAVSVYIPAERSAAEALAFIKDRLAEAKIEGKLELVGLFHGTKQSDKSKREELTVRLLKGFGKRGERKGEACDLSFLVKAD